MALQVLLWLGAAFCVTGALFLLLPVRVLMSWRSEPAEPTILSLRLFGGFLGPIRVYDSSRPKKPPKPEKKARKRRGKARGGGGLHFRDAPAEALLLLRRIIAALDIREAWAEAEFGLGDPAETGQLYGQLCPLIHTTGFHLRLHPNFDRACLSGAAFADIRVIPAAILGPFIRFGWRVFGPV